MEPQAGPIGAPVYCRISNDNFDMHSQDRNAKTDKQLLRVFFAICAINRLDRKYACLFSKLSKISFCFVLGHHIINFNKNQEGSMIFHHAVTVFTPIMKGKRETVVQLVRK